MFERRQRGGLAVPAALVGGAAAFAVLRGALDVTFNATPLLVGLTVAAATAVSRPPRSWGAASVLSVWGVAVLLVREGPLPGREAPIFMIAVALGLLLAAAATPAAQRDQALLSGAAAALAGGLLFYLNFDYAGTIMAWQPWSIGLLVMAGIEALRPRS